MKRILTIMLCTIVFCFTSITAFASESDVLSQYPPLPDSSYTNDYYVIYKYYALDPKMIHIASNSPVTMILRDDGYYEISATTDVYFANLSQSNGIWVVDGQTQTQVNHSVLINPQTYPILYSSINIYKSDGTIFFQKASPPTLAEIVERATEKTLAEKVAELGGTITIVTLCGVTCLACLMVLSLFGKRSLISRG